MGRVLCPRDGPCGRGPRFPPPAPTSSAETCKRNSNMQRRLECRRDGAGWESWVVRGQQFINTMANRVKFAGGLEFSSLGGVPQKKKSLRILSFAAEFER